MNRPDCYAIRVAARDNTCMSDTSRRWPHRLVGPFLVPKIPPRGSGVRVNTVPAQPVEIAVKGDLGEYIAGFLAPLAAYLRGPTLSPGT